MKPPEKMIIYNLFPLLAGKFTDWEKHLIRASEMGFNWVFVNPIQRPGKSGSLYSIADYYALNPLLVDKESRKKPQQQVKDVAGTAGKLGLSLMVDLVINHCAADSELIKTHPKWFKWEESGRVAHPSCDENGKRVVWKDLAKFDHNNSRDKEGLFRFLVDVVMHLIDLGFKGFRCDAAYQVPRAVWKRLISKIRKRHPEVKFFAETLGCSPDQTIQTAGAGFDYIFNSSKWWDFKGQWLMKQYALTREIAPSIGFPESHDTVRLYDELDGNMAGMKQRYLFSALFSSGVMMPIGFEYGFRKKLHVIKTRPQDWETTEVDMTHFIKAVNKLKAEHAIFQEEAPTEILYYNNPNLLLLWKASTTTQEECLIIVNKDIFNKQHLYVESLQEFVQAGAPLVDLSPEYQMNYISSPFSYDLRPGQGIVLMTLRDLPK